MKELIAIQTELKAPKNQRNDFGKYNYRSLEDITEAIKPLLLKYQCQLTFSDEIVPFGEPRVVKVENKDGSYEVVAGLHIYVKATAMLTNSTGESVSAVGWARHADDKKGMDDSQITGATSSYARKYAANALLAIDDCRDADVTNKHGKETPETPRGAATAPPRTQTRPAAQSRPQLPPAASAPVCANNPETDTDKMIKFMASLGVTVEMMQAAIGTDVANFADDDKAIIKRAVQIMRKDNLDFEAAMVEAQN